MTSKLPLPFHVAVNCVLAEVTHKYERVPATRGAVQRVAVVSNQRSAASVRRIEDGVAGGPVKDGIVVRSWIEWPGRLPVRRHTAKPGAFTTT